jgi:hypothetical protein
MRVKSDDEGRDSEGSYTTRLGVTLLNTSNMASDIFHRDGVLYGKTMTLAFYPSLVDQDTTIGC